MAKPSVSKYGQMLRDPRWQKKRLEIMGRDKFACRLCWDDASTLNVHHLWYARGAEPWDYPDTALVTVCDSCHEELHAGRFGDFILEALIQGGATLDGLFSTLTAFQLLFEGPDPRRITPEGWDRIGDSINAALEAVHRGATADQIRNALRGLARDA